VVGKKNRAINTFNALPPSDAVRKQKFFLEDLSSSVLSHFEKYHPSGNLKFINLSIFPAKYCHNLKNITPLKT